MNAMLKKRRSISAFVAIFLLLMTQVMLAGAAFAQTKEAQSSGAQGNTAGSNLSPQGRRTDDTVPNPYIDAPGFVDTVNNSSDVNLNGGSYNGGGTRGIDRNVNDMLKRDNPYGAAEQGEQPYVFTDMSEANQSQQGGGNGTVEDLLGQGAQRARSTLVMQAAEQQRRNPQSDVNNLLTNSLGSINETYRGMHQWFNDDIIGNLFEQIGQLIGKWLSELIDGWIADTVQFLAAFLRVFVLNPNVAVNGLNGSPDDGISSYIRQGADVMYGIACDLLLLLFILSIWKYWVEASNRGAGNLMGSVGRLIATAGLMLAFPTLYAFEIQITNEMIKAIYFNSSDQVLMLDSALASAVRGGILAGVGGLASAFAPLLGGIGLGVIGGTVGEIFAFAGLMIFTILGGILIAELVYILILKAIQTALLTAQYMFAPIFIVFFATPDTENVCSGFFRAWVETSLWTFVWVGLLKIMVIIMFSDYNPWGKILMSVGVLQLMIQVPTFLARAQISPMSDFISAGLVTGGLFKAFGAMGKFATARSQQAANYLMNDKYSAAGLPQSTNPGMDNINRQAGNPDLVKNLKDASKLGREGNKAGVPGVVPPGVKTGATPGDPNATNPTAGQGLNAKPEAKPGMVPPITPPSKVGADASKGGIETGTPGSELNPTAGASTDLVPPTKPGSTPPAGLPGGIPLVKPDGKPASKPGATGASSLVPPIAGAAALGAALAGAGGGLGAVNPAAIGAPGLNTGPIPPVKPGAKPGVVGVPGSEGVEEEGASPPIEALVTGKPGAKPGAKPGVTPPGVIPGVNTPAGAPGSPTNPSVIPAVAGAVAGAAALGTAAALAGANPAVATPGSKPAAKPGAVNVGVEVPEDEAAPIETLATAKPGAKPAAKPGATVVTPGAPGAPTTPTPQVNPAAVGAAALGGAALGAGAAAVVGGIGGGGNRPTGTGGGAAGEPVDGKPEPTWEEQKLSSRYYHNPGMYGVDSVRGIVAQIKTLGTRIQEGAAGNSVEGTTKGGASIIKLREGASDAEKAHVLMSTGFANRTHDDPAAMDAAREATIEAGADRPRGLVEGMAANLMAYSGKSFKQSAVAKNRFQREMYANAVHGSEAYIGGQQGNAYTEYLRGRYGGWTGDMDATAVWLATDQDASESAWNPAIAPATDALAASGLAITGATRGAIQNPQIMTMRPGARKAAVKAVLRASMYDPRMEGRDPGTMEGGVLLGEIAKSMPESYVQTAIAVDAVSGGKDLSPDNLQAIGQLSSELNVPPDSIYRASSLASGWVAKGVTGNASALGARSFDQVRRVVNAQHVGSSNPEAAKEAYQNVLVDTADRVRDMNTAGITTRMMTDPGFANDLHQFIDTSCPDIGNRDSVRSAIVASGTTVRQLGTAGFTQKAAAGVLQYIQDGNNPQQLNGQDITVLEKLTSVGGSNLNLSQSMVQVARNLPAFQSGGTITPNDIQAVQDIASQVELGNARPDQAIAVKNVLDSGGTVSRGTVEVAARLMRQSGGFDTGMFRVQADLLANEVVRSPGDAHMVVSNCVNSAARTAGIDPSNKAIPQILSELQQISPNYSMDTVQQTISNISRGGNFDSRQMVDPVVFEAAYQAQNFMPTNSHRVASIQIAERIHGSAALSMPDVMETYDDVLEAGVNPEQMNSQRYFAARALKDYKSANGVPASSGPQPVYQVLERIRQDSRFQANGASLQSPPQLDGGLFSDLMNMRQW